MSTFKFVFESEFPISTMTIPIGFTFGIFSLIVIEIESKLSWGIVLIFEYRAPVRLLIEAMMI